MHAKLFHLSLLASATLVAGCASLKLQMVDRSVQRPSNIAVYFTVDTSRGDPVADLTPADFHIYEDGQPVSVFESKQTILQPEVAAAHFTLLLVDMSGSVVGSPDLDKVVAGAASFAQRVGRYQKLGIYAFDGSPHVTQVVPFGGGDPQGTLRAFAGFQSKDPSTNLNGAVVEAIKILDHQMSQSPLPLRFGTLVVFTDGTDHAARVSRKPCTACSTMWTSRSTPSRSARRSTTRRSGHRAQWNLHVEESGGHPQGLRRDRGAGRGLLAALLPAVVLHASARRRTQRGDRSGQGRDAGPPGLRFQSRWLWSQLRPEPEAGVQRAPSSHASATQAQEQVEAAIAGNDDATIGSGPYHRAGLARVRGAVFRRSDPPPLAADLRRRLHPVSLRQQPGCWPRAWCGIAASVSRAIPRRCGSGLLVVGKLADADLPVLAGAMGVACSGLCLVLVHRFAIALVPSRGVAAAACAAASLVYPLYFWAPAGLETTLVAALVTFAACSLVVPSAWRWSLAAALLGVARPEGPLLACALAVLARVAHGRSVVRPGALALGLAPALAWLFFRKAYYGDWLPNTYYAKATGTLMVRLEAGLLYAVWALGLLAAVALTLWFARIADRKLAVRWPF
jgi:hypothetical protein